jgi:hypothetical protein
MEFLQVVAGQPVVSGGLWPKRPHGLMPMQASVVRPAHGRSFLLKSEKGASLSEAPPKTV